jgi:hypothetical protein
MPPSYPAAVQEWASGKPVSKLLKCPIEFVGSDVAAKLKEGVGLQEGELLGLQLITVRRQRNSLV